MISETIVDVYYICPAFGNIPVVRITSNYQIGVFTFALLPK
jgi:hypothetical protein